MKEFYQDYLKQLLKNVFEEFKKGNKEKAREYALEIKELNKQMFFDKELV